MDEAAHMEDFLTLNAVGGDCLARLRLAIAGVMRASVNLHSRVTTDNQRPSVAVTLAKSCHPATHRREAREGPRIATGPPQPDVFVVVRWMPLIHAAEGARIRTRESG